MTVIYKFDIDILKVYLHTKQKFLDQVSQKISNN